MAFKRSWVRLPSAPPFRSAQNRYGRLEDAHGGSEGRLQGDSVQATPHGRHLVTCASAWGYVELPLREVRLRWLSAAGSSDAKNSSTPATRDTRSSTDGRRSATDSSLNSRCSSTQTRDLVRPSTDGRRSATDSSLNSRCSSTQTRDLVRHKTNRIGAAQTATMAAAVVKRTVASLISYLLTASTRSPLRVFAAISKSTRTASAPSAGIDVAEEMRCTDVGAGWAGKVPATKTSTAGNAPEALARRSACDSSLFVLPHRARRPTGQSRPTYVL